MKRLRRIGLFSMATVSLAACSSNSGATTAAPVAAQLSVERFLQAANQHDVQAMGRLFGTVDGPAMDTGNAFGCFFKKVGSWFGGSACTRKLDVELRMDAIASIVQHRDYRIVREEPVAGRTTQARRVYVDLTMSDGRVGGAPFLVIQTREGRWLIEQVPLERIMARR